MSSAASQSRSSGWAGGLPLRPKSKTVGTSGDPKWRVQIWLTATRAVSGLRRSVIHLASACRRPLLRGGKAPRVVLRGEQEAGRRPLRRRPASCTPRLGVLAADLTALSSDSRRGGSLLSAVFLARRPGVSRTSACRDGGPRQRPRRLRSAARRGRSRSLRGTEVVPVRRAEPRSPAWPRDAPRPQSACAGPRAVGTAAPASGSIERASPSASASARAVACAAVTCFRGAVPPRPPAISRRPTRGAPAATPRGAVDGVDPSGSNARTPGRPARAARTCPAALVAADEAVRGRVELAVEDARDAVLGQIRLAGHTSIRT